MAVCQRISAQLKDDGPNQGNADASKPEEQDGPQESKAARQEIRRRLKYGDERINAPMQKRTMTTNLQRAMTEWEYQEQINQPRVKAHGSAIRSQAQATPTKKAEL